MADLLRRIDDLLRADSSGGAVGERLVPVRLALLACAVLGIIAGACTGVYAVANHSGDLNLSQMFASSIKVPLLFLLTLVVTFPSLYVFSALLGVELYPAALLRMILSAIVVTLALGASFGPITAFFALSTTNYHFMVVLTVVVFGFGGIVGLVFLLRALRGVLMRSTGEPAAAPAAPAVREDEPQRLEVPDADMDADAPAPAPAPAPLDDLTRNERIATVLFRIWVVVYGLVGAQMAWVLRPFIGDPNAAFTWFRPRESNFFSSAIGHLRDLLF